MVGIIIPNVMVTLSTVSTTFQRDIVTTQTLQERLVVNIEFGLELLSESTIRRDSPRTSVLIERENFCKFLILSTIGSFYLDSSVQTKRLLYFVIIYLDFVESTCHYRTFSFAILRFGNESVE